MLTNSDERMVVELRKHLMAAEANLAHAQCNFRRQNAAVNVKDHLLLVVFGRLCAADEIVTGIVELLGSLLEDRSLPDPTSNKTLFG